MFLWAWVNNRLQLDELAMLQEHSSFNAYSQWAKKNDLIQDS